MASGSPPLVRMCLKCVLCKNCQVKSQRANATTIAAAKRLPNRVRRVKPRTRIKAAKDARAAMTWSRCNIATNSSAESARMVQTARKRRNSPMPIRIPNITKVTAAQSAHFAGVIFALVSAIICICISTIPVTAARTPRAPQRSEPTWSWVSQINNPRCNQQRRTNSERDEIRKAQTSRQSTTGKPKSHNAENKRSNEKWTNHRSLLGNLDQSGGTTRRIRNHLKDANPCEDAEHNERQHENTRASNQCFLCGAHIIKRVRCVDQELSDRRRKRPGGCNQR